MDMQAEHLSKPLAKNDAVKHPDKAPSMSLNNLFTR
jgi:hypothetical protein